MTMVIFINRSRVDARSTFLILCLGELVKRSMSVNCFITKSWWSILSSVYHCSVAPLLFFEALDKKIVSLVVAPNRTLSPFHITDLKNWNWKLFLLIWLSWAFAKSLASEQSRDITFAAPVPWFQIQTLTLTPTLTLTNTPNHTLTLARSQTLTRPRNETFFPV